VRENAPILGNLASDFNFSQPPRKPMLLPTNPHTDSPSIPPYFTGTLGRWRSLWIRAQALGAAAPALEVAQLPPAAWAGRTASTIPSGTLSLIVHRPTAATPAHGWAGLVVDEWNETVPTPVQHTALSFRYQAPVAEAPQAVLLAVPPAPGAAWDPEALVDTVRETLTLAKIRAVDGSLLNGLRPFLPAIFLTANTANEAVSTNLLGTLTDDPKIRTP
jgi:hypothetical protein